MNLIRNSNTLALLLGGMWSIVISVLISVAMSFLTGFAFKPNLINSAALGTIAGVLFLHLPNRTYLANAKITHLLSSLKQRNLSNWA